MTISERPLIKTVAKAAVQLNVPITLNMDVQQADEVVVYYDNDDSVAIYNVDYTVQLSLPPTIPPYKSATVTPLAGLVSKAAINGVGITIVYQPNHTQIYTQALGKLDTEEIERSLDRNLMRAQRVREDLGYTLRRARNGGNFVGDGKAIDDIADGLTPDSAVTRRQLDGIVAEGGVFSEVATVPDAEAGTDNTKGMTPARTVDTIRAAPVPTRFNTTGRAVGERIDDQGISIREWNGVSGVPLAEDGDEDDHFLIQKAIDDLTAEFNTIDGPLDVENPGPTLVLGRIHLVSETIDGSCDGLCLQGRGGHFGTKIISRSDGSVDPHFPIIRWGGSAATDMNEMGLRDLEFQHRNDNDHTGNFVIVENITEGQFRNLVARDGDTQFVFRGLNKCTIDTLRPRFNGRNVDPSAVGVLFEGTAGGPNSGMYVNNLDMGTSNAALSWGVTNGVIIKGLDNMYAYQWHFNLCERPIEFHPVAADAANNNARCAGFRAHGIYCDLNDIIAMAFKGDVVGDTYHTFDIYGLRTRAGNYGIHFDVDSPSVVRRVRIFGPEFKSHKVASVFWGNSNTEHVTIVEPHSLDANTSGNALGAHYRIGGAKTKITGGRAVGGNAAGAAVWLNGTAFETMIKGLDLSEATTTVLVRNDGDTSPDIDLIYHGTIPSQEIVDGVVKFRGFNNGQERLDTEAAAASDDLWEIQNVPVGREVTISTTDATRDIVVRSMDETSPQAGANLRLNGDRPFTLSSPNGLITFRRRVGLLLQEVSRYPAYQPQRTTGSVTVNNPTTSTVVTHGLISTPDIKNIDIRLGDSGAGVTRMWVSTITSTQFTINFVTPSTSAIILWEAWIP